MKNKIIGSTLILVIFLTVTWFLWLSPNQSAKQYIEIFENAGFNVMKGGKIDYYNPQYPSTHNVEDFTDYMTWWTTRMQDPVIYWFKDSKSRRIIFYYIDVNGRFVCFIPKVIK